MSTVSFVLFLMFSLIFPLFSPFHPLWHVTIVSDLIHASTFSPSLIWSHIYVLYLHMFMGVICLFFILWPLSFAIFLIFLWLLWVLVVAHRIFDLFLWHVGSRSLTRDWTQPPLHWECRFLATGPPVIIFLIYDVCIEIPPKWLFSCNSFFGLATW